jgi:hypothetical protein
VVGTLAPGRRARQTALDRRQSTDCGKACARDVAGRGWLVERAHSERVRLHEQLWKPLHHWSAKPTRRLTVKSRPKAEIR